MISKLFLAASCYKKLPHEVREVYPIMPVSITPQKDTFRVNDTLTLEIDFPEQLRDSLSGQMVTFKNFNFGSIIVFLLTY